MAKPMDLRSLVRAQLTGTSEADPGVIADRVFASLPKSQHGVALGLTLRAYVRMVMREQRNAPVALANVTPMVRPSGSAKVAAIRETWRLRLNDRLLGASEWVLRGDASYEDLMFAAESREAQAHANIAAATELRLQAQTILDYGASCLRELSTTVLADLLGGAA